MKKYLQGYLVAIILILMCAQVVQGQSLVGTWKPVLPKQAPSPSSTNLESNDSDSVTFTDEFMTHIIAMADSLQKVMEQQASLAIAAVNVTEDDVFIFLPNGTYSFVSAAHKVRWGQYKVNTTKKQLTLHPDANKAVSEVYTYTFTAGKQLQLASKGASPVLLKKVESK